MIRTLLVLVLVTPALRAEMPQLIFQPSNPARVRIEGGPFGTALERNLSGHLMRFVTGPASAPVQMFNGAARATNLKADRTGEHAGKWLTAAARAAQRSGDSNLAILVRDVADALVATQEADGYLGTYAPELRFTSDSVYRKRETWDLWVHGSVLEGILEVHRYWPDPRYLQAARRIGDLIDTTLRGGKNVAYLGGHRGLSGAAILGPVMDLYFATKDARYLLLARRILEQADERQDLQLMLQARKKSDLSLIGDGQVHSMIELFTGVAKLYRAAGDGLYLEMAKYAWQNIQSRHLTPGGGPWGGVGVGAEYFSAPDVFDPTGVVDVCALGSWIGLNRELLIVTGDARYADEIERAAYNDLLAAQFPNGADWCAFVHPNGPAKAAEAGWACRSNGAVALESLSSIAAGPLRDGWAINLYAPMRLSLMSKDGLDAEFAVKTAFPYQPDIEIRALPRTETEVSLYLRIPAWTQASIELNGLAIPFDRVDGYARISRRWKRGDTVVLRLPLTVRTQTATDLRRQEGGGEVMRRDFVAYFRGPLSYASGPVDGYRREETLPVAPGEAVTLAEASETPAAPVLDLKVPNRPPIRLVPAYLADRRWRITWWNTK
jgi:DUF1680 family protein